jgi:primosomal protein N' (replication factor Y)
VGGNEPARRLQAGGRVVGPPRPDRQGLAPSSPQAASDLLVAKVLPDVGGIDRSLDYSVPPRLAGEVRPGCVVRVPLGGRRVRGWVVSVPVEPPAGIALRPIARVSGWGPEPELFQLATWAAWRWAGRQRSLLVTASAPVSVKALPPPALAAAASAHERGDTGADLLRQAWRGGTHVLRLPPAASATDLVLAAAERGPVLVLAPTVARAEAGATALRARRAGVALLPSEWAQARAGSRIVIGSRGAAWGPCPGMASVVVLDAHDEAYVQGTMPTWSAPDVVAERARLAGVPCFWVSPCPTLELLASAQKAWAPSKADERRGWAALQVVDRRSEDPRSGLFSRQLTAAVRDTARRVVCVLNRKGKAVLLDCAACGELVTCDRCGGAASMVGEELVCRRCGDSRPPVCAKCGSLALRSLRLGTAGVREQLEALAGRPVAVVAAGAGPFPEAPVVVGTEALLYREGELHRTGGASVVAFLDFDQELLAPRFRAGEEALALLARASRLVGGRRGTVLVQTRSPAHPVLKAALLADPSRVSAAEEPLRKELRLPPFAALALVSGAGARDFVEALATAAAGAVEASKLREDRWLLRAPGPDELAEALALAGRPKKRVRVEVGPARL